jgi:hypothetical protein
MRNDCNATCAHDAQFGSSLLLTAIPRKTPIPLSILWRPHPTKMRHSRMENYVFLAYRALGWILGD